MRSFIIAFLLIATTAFAAEYAPKLFTYVSYTKTGKLSVNGTPVVTLAPTADTSVYLNGTGSDWVVKSGTERDIYVFRNISTLAFISASSASTSPNKVRVMVH
jgi:hypothetical protein